MFALKLAGKVVIVTGAARGIGRAIAKRFAEEGAKVVVNYNTSEREASSLADEIRREGGQSIVVKADVTRSEEVNRLVKTTVEKYGRVDVLVNNAGIIIREDFLDAKEETWDRTIDTNLKSVYLCSKAVAPIMLDQKKGKIINISSVSGLAQRTALDSAPYSASKAGIIGLTRFLAINLSPHINVNAICPGMIDTGMIMSRTPERRRMFIDDTPLKRFGKPEEVANLALFLASDDSDFMTGEMLTLSGGRGMR